MKQMRERLKKAFSLTEVTVALGIIGFCAIAVMGLLPVIVQTQRRSQDQTQATQILSNFLAGFQAPSTNAAGEYRLSYPFDSVGWTTNGTAIGVAPLTYFDVNGETNGSDMANARYVLTYTMIAPTNSDPLSMGTVTASVSWPGQQATNTSPKYQGSLSGTVIFRSPIQP